MKHRSMVTVASWIPEQTLEEVETFRWGNRLSRSEFIRQSIELHLELIRRSRQEQRTQRKHNN